MIIPTSLFYIANHFNLILLFICLSHLLNGLLLLPIQHEVLHFKQFCLVVLLALGVDRVHLGNLNKGFLH